MRKARKSFVAHTHDAAGGVGANLLERRQPATMEAVVLRDYESVRSRRQGRRREKREIQLEARQEEAARSPGCTHTQRERGKKLAEAGKRGKMGWRTDGRGRREGGETPGWNGHETSKCFSPPTPDTVAKFGRITVSVYRQLPGALCFRRRPAYGKQHSVS